MIIIVIIVVIVLITIYQSKHEDHSIEAAKKWKPYFAEGWSEPPDWVLETHAAERKEQERHEEYEKNHFYDVYHECWIKQISEDYFVKSIPYDEWEDGERDELEPIKPIWYVDAWEYDEDDPEGWAEKERRAHELWLIHG